MQNSIKFQWTWHNAKAVVQDIRLEVWSRSIGGATTELDCYGLAPVLKVSDDKIDYNRANIVSFCCFLLL
jgi:hypothetical protein